MRTVRTVPEVRTVQSPTVPKVQAPAPTIGTAGTVRTVRTIENGDFKDELLAAIKSGKATFYNLVVAQAYRIDATPAGVTFTFQANQKAAKGQCEEQKAWLQGVVEKVAGRLVPVSIVMSDAGTAPASAPTLRAAPDARDAPDAPEDPMKNSTVQAVLEIFPIEKTTVEER